jgi:hypothetical protein
MTRILLAGALAAGLAATVAAPANAALVAPCHGTTYRYGALVWDPVSQRWIRMCIEQG